MTFLELAKKILLKNIDPLTPNEIWQIACNEGHDKNLNSKGKTPWATLGAQLYVSAKSNPNNIFSLTNSRPKRFYLTSLKSKINFDKNIQEKSTSSPIKKKHSFKEIDLHPFLTYYASLYLKVATKTINHLNSSKSEFGEWVHPDMVGCYFPFNEWKSEVYDLSSSIGNVTISLFSFELKRELNFGNLRSSFFQTVSNSTWANESYLVAAEISNEEEFTKELTRLSSAFGIGVIKLNIEEPDSTEIILPAKIRETLDWDTIDKLTMNNDFTEFLTRIKIDISSKKVHAKEYDKVFDNEELKKTILKN
jgi:hypothetical protein